MRTLAIRIALLVAALAVSFAAGFGLASANWQERVDEAELARSEAEEQRGVIQRGLSRAQDRTWKYYREQQLLEAEIARLTGSDLEREVPQYGTGTEPGTFGDGIYLVGEDIEPGVYDGTVAGALGYWARLRATTGQVSGIIANGLPRGPFVLEIAPADEAVELRGVVITAGE